MTIQRGHPYTGAVAIRPIGTCASGSGEVGFQVSGRGVVGLGVSAAARQ